MAEVALPRAFQDRVDRWAQEAIASGATTFDDLARAVPGVSPPEVAAALPRLAWLPEGLREVGAADVIEMAVGQEDFFQFEATLFNGGEDTVDPGLNCEGSNRLSGRRKTMIRHCFP